MTKVRLYALGTSTTLESNKSAAGKQAARAGGLLAGAVVARRDERTAFLLGEPGLWVRRPAQAFSRRWCSRSGREQISTLD